MTETPKQNIQLEPSKYKKFYDKLDRFLQVLDTTWHIGAGTTITEIEKFLDEHLKPSPEDSTEE